MREIVGNTTTTPIALSKVATTGLFGDIEETWDIEIIFDGGTFFDIAKLDEAKLDTTKLA